ncbi:acid protease [Artomyces pyxidatus]|uniref:Acid protease n=1 Tax=Artomyces pyxidatus TaxID=48021 RepID=A0ACB8T827_9AGAM|nr:acid protease [Artomyces pyxidatus]
MRWLAPLPLVLLVEIQHFANAARVPFQARTITSRSVYPRANVSGLPIQNTQNVQYIGNITLGGAPYSVILDTGSSDLWVAANVPNATDTGKAVSLSYAIGQANGNVNTAQLGFDNYTIDNQAFVLVKDTSSFSSSFQTDGYQGLIGLGPNTGSVVRTKVGDSSADSPLFRIFEQNKTSQNFISITLDRKGDPGDPVTGELTISEIIPGYEAIQQTTKLTVKDVPTLTSADQHWAVFTDQNGVLGPDGQVIDVSSIVPRAPSKQLVAVFDSGFSLPQVPRAMSDAIYGRVQGAAYDTTNGWWTLPCDQELNLTFIFGGKHFPIHPLDINSNDLGATDANGNPVCVGLFQPITSAFSLLGEYDMILGMGFLRNAYTLIDFGNFVSDASNDRSDPFVQLLPLTDPAQMHADFVKVRLNGVDTTGSPSKALLPASQESHSPETAAEKKQHEEGAVLRYWPYILVGCLAFVLLVVGGCVWACCCRRRKAPRAKGVPFGGFQNPYQSIHEPAPPPLHMQTMGSQYADPYRP